MLLIGGIAALATLAASFVGGLLGPRVFAAACLSVMAAASFLYYKTAKVASDTPPHLSVSNRSGKSVRRALLLVGALIWLFISFWLLRGQPLVPRLVGACVFIAFVAAYCTTRR